MNTICKSFRSQTVRAAKKVLIVDDSKFARNTLALILTNQGYDVVGEAKNGIEALHLFRLLRPDLVLLDINMPEMDGLETLRAIRLIDDRVKVIVVSSMDQEFLIKDALIVGAVGFVTKPIRRNMLVKMLANIN
ncbi:MAG: response regulator [Syntrophomonadaceae bacterium]|nr:response regulator [Syntrophomonadaceae bacterium]